MIRPTVAYVDLDRLRSNFRRLASFLARESAVRSQPVPGIIGVVKANGYGHGLAEVARSYQDEGAAMLGVADLEEGIALRRAGITAPILVFGVPAVADLAAVFDHGLTPTVATPEAGLALQQAAASRRVRIRYHLKVDSGMGRLGLRAADLAQTAPSILSAPNLELAGVSTHFATADEPAHPLFDRQRRAFAGALALLRDMGIPDVPIHAAGSAATLREPGTWYDYVRPGLALYGAAPRAWSPDVSFEPVMSVRSRVVSVKTVLPGESVGYGARFVAARPATVAIVPAGYADGIDRRSEGRVPILIAGRRVPLVGSVCMDMIAADVTGLDVSVGDEVVLIGSQGEESLDVVEVAERIGTVSYEVLCGLGARISRIYNPPQPICPPGQDGGAARPGHQL